MNILTIALFCEGTTDQRFFKPIVQRTYEAILGNATSQPEVDILIEYMGKSTLEEIGKTVEDADGYLVAVVHVDADGRDVTKHFKSIVEPILEQLALLEQPPIGMPLIPIYETEAWMLADIELLKKFLNTTKTKQELDLTQLPENIAKPKEALNHAIRIVQQDLPPKLRKQLDIKYLYALLGEAISIEKLQQLSAYQAFYSAAEQNLKQLNFIP